jgi:Protein of unknown function (DUF2007).
MKVVKKFTDAFSANIAKGMLENHGIQAHVLNQNMAFVTGAINTDLLSIELVVDDKDYLEAKKLLALVSNAE